MSWHGTGGRGAAPIVEELRAVLSKAFPVRPPTTAESVHTKVALAAAAERRHARAVWLKDREPADVTTE